MSRQTDTTYTGDEGSARRRRMILAGTLIALMLLLAALIGYAYVALSPIGAPDNTGNETGFAWIRSIYGWGEDPDQQFQRPTDVAVAPDGKIWGTDPVRARVLGFNPDGTFAGLIHTGPASSAEGHIFRPEGVEVGPTGEIFIADFGSDKVLVFTEDNEFVREWEVPRPLDVAVNADTIAVTTIYGVATFDDQGDLITKWGTRGSDDDQFDIARGIALDDEGRVFVADTQNSRVKAYTTDGELLWISGQVRDAAEITTSTPIPGENDQAEAVDPDSPFQLPSGMTLDGNGRIVLVDPFEFKIMVVDPDDGSLIASYGEYGLEDGSFVYPTGIDYDPARDWFAVADTTNDRLQVVTLPDSGGGIGAAAMRLLVWPLWLCSIPLILLLIAIAILVAQRRRQPYEEERHYLDEGEAAEVDAEDV